jgi:hypothetical protein
MKPTPITLEEYEAAERELALRQAKHVWRVHASVFALAAATSAVIELSQSGSLWWPYVLLVGWALVLFAHYSWTIRYGEAHAREQQIRVEWRAGRAREDLAHR